MRFVDEPCTSSVCAKHIIALLADSTVNTWVCRWLKHPLCANSWTSIDILPPAGLILLRSRDDYCPASQRPSEVSGVEHPPKSPCFGITAISLPALSTKPAAVGCR